MGLSVVILAAGLGKRMFSKTPKVLHEIAGKPLLEHVYNTVQLLKPSKIYVVYGHQGHLVRHALAHLDVQWVEQKALLGTGHALLQALPLIPDTERVLVLYGDVPLISDKTLQAFLEIDSKALGVVTALLADPTGLGRIIRNKSQKIINIVEEKDATAIQKEIKEVNTGIYLCSAQLLKKWLPLLTNANAQNEFYLTDIFQKAFVDKINIESLCVQDTSEVTGVNDRAQLAALERIYQTCFAQQLMKKGVTIFDPARFDVRGNLTIGKDVTFDINVIIEGNVTVGDECVIGANCILRNVILGSHVEVKPHSVIDGAEISDHCVIGPFARIRPGSILSKEAHVGNFVEIKNSFIDEKSKVNHLTYIGDSDIGKKVNVGAGTITCNYDGVNKHRTLIGDNVFIGSNSALVAPLKIGEAATIGAGSTITRDVTAGKLTLARAEQCTIENWKRPTKKEKES